MPDDVTRSTDIPEPTGPPITFRGEKVTAGMILRLWRSGMNAKKHSRAQILKCRSFRRNEDESKVKLAPSWVRTNPEAAASVVKVLTERVSLDRDLIARIGVVEPEYNREPLGFLDTDIDNAEECESYLNEWRLKNVPTQAFFGKNTEDGEFGLVVIPAPYDIDGVPDFYEMLDEQAYEHLNAEDKKGYKRHTNDKRDRYVKLDERGLQKRTKHSEPDPPSDIENAEKDADKKEELKKKRYQKADERYDEAVRSYLLNQQATNVKLIPALNCAPIFGAGKRRDRWDLLALVERSLYYREELLENDCQSPLLGDRQIIPLPYEADGKTRMAIEDNEIGEHGQFYLYTAYIMCRGEDGKRHPVIASCVGGSQTYNSVSGADDDDQSVILVDFYEQYKTEDGCSPLEGAPLWSYHGGLHTEDDDPDWYWQPYLSAFLETIQTIESNATSINAAVRVNSFTGHHFTPDAALVAAIDNDDAFLDQDSELKKPKMPRPGEIEVSAGPIVPANQARVGEDAWRQLANDQLSLQMATAVDQTQGGSGQSGHALVVQSTLAQVAKRHIREGTLDAVVSAGEKHLRILHAIEKRWGIRWPIQTTQERPVGHEQREGRAPSEFNPDWIGNNNYNLVAEYPAEENIALRDMEMNAAERGFGDMDRVARAMGERDTMTLRFRIARDRLWQSPHSQMLLEEMVAKKSGNRKLQQIIKLQAQQMMSKAEVPGIGPVPSAALRRQGEAAASGSGRQTAGSASRAGQMSGEMQTAAQRADGEAQLVAGQGAA